MLIRQSAHAKLLETCEFHMGSCILKSLAMQ